MSRSSEPEERAQCTVAELLARYGEAAPAPGRRHRRAAQEPAAAAYAAAQPVADRNESPQSYSATQHEVTQNEVTQNEVTQPHLNGRAGQGWAPAVGPASVVPGRVLVTPPLAAARAPLRWTTRADDPVTEQLPRLDPVPAVVPAPVPVDPAPAADEAQAQESGSPWWEWAVMVSQVGIGIVGGAALWLICEWLWKQIPVVALVVALAVITGLVWVVRRVRRAEDLQTTVIAVLVGLFVTVSPAALLLVGR
ncbi:MAG: hypothetical protein ACRDRW_20790 [Pseudonocardiaceae bacterium]